MHIRCGNCHGAIWVELTGASIRACPIACPLCGKEYRLDFAGDAEETGSRLAAEARQLVLETQVDLPSAYSILLGVMSLEESLDLGDASSPACQTAPEEPSRGHGKMSTYDPAFQPAVDAGRLTPLQAMQRGIRQKYVSLVARRHRLSEEVAVEVADNKISLLEALRRRRPDSAPPLMLVAAAPPPSRWGWWMAAGVAAAAIVIVAVAVGSSPSTGTSGPASAGAVRRSSILGAEVRSDEWGRTLEVSAPDPKSVLAAFCASDGERRFEPVDVLPSPSEGGGERLGLIRRAGRSGELLAINVREDRLGNRWVAGDGAAPLVPHTAPPAAAQAIQPH